jgi:hypothetical protein
MFASTTRPALVFVAPYGFGRPDGSCFGVGRSTRHECLWPPGSARGRPRDPTATATTLGGDRGGCEAMGYALVRAEVQW